MYLHRTSFFICCAAALLCCGAVAFGGPVEPELGGIIDLPHLADPPLVMVKADRVFDVRLEGLWLKALARPDPSVRRQAIEAFAKAHGEGMAVSDQAGKAIQQRINGDEDVHVRLSAVAAMVQLDRRGAAEDVLTFNQQLVHPLVTPQLDDVLETWHYKPAGELWRQRADNAQYPLAVRRSAIQSLGIIVDGDARDLLLQLSQDQATDTYLQLVAAEALGRVTTSGLVAPAAQLASEGPLGALRAIRMLAAHEDDAALTLLEKLTGYETPAVAAAAARRLVVISPQRVSPSLAHHDDPDVRLSATRAATNFQTNESVLLLAGRLDDVSVAVRTLARNTLIDWANETSLRPVVESQMQQVWSSAGWRGREQAALICGWIDDKDAADRLAAALRDDRAEVRLAVCAALRQLQVRRTGEVMTTRVEELTQPPSEDQPYDPSASFEATQLILALGTMNVRSAEAVFRKIIPKHSPPSPAARAAAIWALGRWHEGTLDEKLASQLAARAADETVMDPESPRVRRFSAIALGRMGAASHLPMLHGYTQRRGGDNEFVSSCRWAIEKITGDPVAPPQLEPANITGWFLDPVD